MHISGNTVQYVCHITNTYHVSAMHKTNTKLLSRINLKMICTGRNM